MCATRPATIILSPIGKPVMKPNHQCRHRDIVTVFHTISRYKKYHDSSANNSGMINGVVLIITTVMAVLHWNWSAHQQNTGGCVFVLGDSKAEIRNKVWDYLTDNRLALFPFPPHRRISNFKVNQSCVLHMCSKL